MNKRKNKGEVEGNGKRWMKGEEKLSEGRKAGKERKEGGKEGKKEVCVCVRMVFRLRYSRTIPCTENTYDRCRDKD